MKKTRILAIFLLILILTIPAAPVGAADTVWELAEVKITPASGSEERATGAHIMGTDDRTLENMAGYHKYATTVSANKMVITITGEDWDTLEGEPLPVSYTHTVTFDFTAPDSLKEGQIATFGVKGSVTTTGNLPSNWQLIGESIRFSGSFFGGDSFQYITSGEERFTVDGPPPGPISNAGSVSYKVPEGDLDEYIYMSAYTSGSSAPPAQIEWFYRATEKISLSLDYSPPLVYFEPGMGADLGFAGELVATLEDEEGKGIEGKKVIFFIDRETPGTNEPGKNLFDVLAYDVAEGTGPIGSIETHPYLTQRILDIHVDLDESLYNDNRIFLGNGVKTDANGEARINVIEYDILDPKKFSGELIRQNDAFGENGKISGNIIAGVYDEVSKFLRPQAAMEIEYEAMAKILSITGEGRPDDIEDGMKYPGRVRVKRFLASPSFDYHPVETGFLLMPGDIVDIDGNAAVEIAWVTGDKVTARVPDKIEVPNVREPYEPPECQIFMLSSAYDAGFMHPSEKAVNSVFGFCAKKGIELLIESIPYVGKVLKEGGALSIEIYNGIKDFEKFDNDIVTRIRIRSKVIIDNTGEDLKVYNLEGSPDIQTANGSEITLAEGTMVAVSDTGVIGDAQPFNKEDVKEAYDDLASTSSHSEESFSDNSGNAEGSGSSLWIIIGGIIAALVILGLVIMLKRKRT